MINKIILKIAIAAFILFVFDFAVGNTLRYFYFKQIAGTAYETSYVIDSTKAEILVFGSSRASHHYIPRAFEDSLGMSCYNAGRNGNFAMYSNAVISVVINRYTPKIIIYDITPGELNIKKDHYERLSSLLPYYQDHPEIRKIIELRGPYEKIKLLSAIYPFNSNLIDIITGNFLLKGRRATIIKGYIPLDKQLSDTVLHSAEDSMAPLDSNMIKDMTAIAQICNQRNIRFVIVTSPLFARYTSNYTGVFLENFAKINHVEYFNFINNSAFIKNPSCFQDRNHMNNEGATRFSKIIASKLKNQILKQHLN